MKNPYDCSVCDNEDCSGCGEAAYENGYSQAFKEVGEWLEEIFFLKCGTIITDGALLDRVLRRCVEALKGGKIP